jgi:hypothetical protein
MFIACWYGSNVTAGNVLGASLEGPMQIKMVHSDGIPLPAKPSWQKIVKKTAIALWFSPS